ncbi:hypothetical protein Cpha266_0199 [Chlorobium phaeobacteroides DSM 266]|uniref:Uncharacterized protein n=1 Tax=Chlorobium phaeobacteroides (strain DSM 266 / SMG 266 / 2430) TaxID=290317 RepID=A1BCY9_CHLPD|nr:hypothetical protein Cpha266_0199 [Chlorobium phaeobacteroides DSM 266]
MWLSHLYIHPPERNPNKEYRRKAGSKSKPTQSRNIFECIMLTVQRTGCQDQANLKEQFGMPFATYTHFARRQRKGFFAKHESSYDESSACTRYWWMKSNRQRKKTAQSAIYL